jgi:acetyl/propionyl-CoA carboxylase alpha subunit
LEDTTPSHIGKDRFDDPTTVHSANTVEEIGYPVMIKASDGDTVLDEKTVSPIKAQLS